MSPAVDHNKDQSNTSQPAAFRNDGRTNWETWTRELTSQCPCCPRGWTQLLFPPDADNKAASVIKAFNDDVVDIRFYCCR